jgi:hypothetical protein
VSHPVEVLPPLGAIAESGKVGLLGWGVVEGLTEFTADGAGAADGDGGDRSKEGSAKCEEGGAAGKALSEQMPHEVEEELCGEDGGDEREGDGVGAAAAEGLAHAGNAIDAVGVELVGPGVGVGRMSELVGFLDH